MLHEVRASAHWHTLAFASDVHLDALSPNTAQRWHQALASLECEALFLLGDMFEAWIGDDVLLAPPSVESDFARMCVAQLRKASERMAIYYMHGNRDFLVGSAFAQASGVTLLNDPCVLVLPDTRRVLLSHGDAWCTDDTAYLAFRSQVRSASWQHDFLSQSIDSRARQAQRMREASRNYQSNRATPSDVNAASVLRTTEQWRCNEVIHGHTHRPDLHAWPQGGSRRVLTDWDAEHEAPRGEFWILSTPTW